MRGALRAGLYTGRAKPQLPEDVGSDQKDEVTIVSTLEIEEVEC